MRGKVALGLDLNSKHKEAEQIPQSILSDAIMILPIHYPLIINASNLGTRPAILREGFILISTPVHDRYFFLSTPEGMKGKIDLSVN